MRSVQQELAQRTHIVYPELSNGTERPALSRPRSKRITAAHGIAKRDSGSRLLQVPHELYYRGVIVGYQAGARGYVSNNSHVGIGVRCDSLSFYGGTGARRWPQTPLTVPPICEGNRDCVFRWSL